MSNRKFHMLLMLGMMILLALCAGGCGGGGGSNSVAQDTNPTPTPIVSPDPTPVPNPTPEPKPTPIPDPKHSDGGSEVLSKNLSPNEAVAEPDNPEKEGFTFMGWFDSEGALFNFGVSVDHNVLLTAEWAQTVSATEGEVAELMNPEHEGIETVSLDNGGSLTGIEVQYKTDGFALVSVSELSEDSMLDAPGLIGRPVEISHIGGEVKEAMITFRYDPLLLSSDASNLGIVWYDESNDILTLLSNDTTVDTERNAVYVVTDHFSKYGVVDKVKWLETANAKLPNAYSENARKYLYIAMECVGYPSGYTGSESLGKRIEAAQNLIDTLNVGDRFYVGGFKVDLPVFIVDGEIAQSDDAVKDQFTKDTAKSNISKGVMDIAESKTIHTYRPQDYFRALNYALRDVRDLLASLNINMQDGNSPEFSPFVVLLCSGPVKTDDEDFYGHFAYDYSFLGLFGYKAIFDKLQDIKDSSRKVLTVGIGSDVYEEFMQKLAYYSGGKYVYAETSADVSENFNEMLREASDEDDTDGDGLTDKAETEGMRDQYHQIIKTDPNNADTDGDGISDDVEMGEYVDGEFKRVSDPRVYTVKSNLALVYSNPLDRRVMNTQAKRITLVASIHDEKCGNIGDKKECLYSPARNLRVEVSFPKNNYSNIGDIRIESRKRSDGTSVYYALITLSYKKYPGKNDTITWRVTADNLARPGTSDERIEYLEDVQYVLDVDDPVRDAGNLTTKLKAWRAVLEKEFIEKLCADAKQGSENVDNNKELKSRRDALQKEIMIYESRGKVPDDVCEAFALAVLDAYDSDGSTIEKYSKDMNELYNQLLKQIASTFKKGDKVVIAGEHRYRIEFNFMGIEKVGVAFANVYMDDAFYATLAWKTSMDNMKTALAAYCTKLAELNKDLWNDFLISYVDYTLSEIGIEVQEGTVEEIFGITENIIKGLCGDKNAANEVVDKLVGAAKDKLKSKWNSDDKLMNFIKDNFPKGDKIVKSAEKLKTLKAKYDDFKGAVDWYNIASWVGGGDGADLRNKFEAFKTAYEELGQEGLLDTTHSLISWPESW